MNQPIGNYRIRAKMMPGPGPQNGVAILHYKGAPAPESLRKQLVKEQQSNEIKEEPEWLQGELCPSTVYRQPDTVYGVPSSIDKEIIIKAFQKTTPDGSKHFDINGLFNAVPKVTLVDLIQKDNLRMSRHSPLIFEILEGENIQIVFINYVGSDGICEQHPWHMHGHNFYVVDEGPDDYNPKIDGVAVQRKFDNITKNDRQTCYPLRDVLILVAKQTKNEGKPGAACGWIAIRFVANNPGIWIVHCHLTAHLIMGKRFELYEHSEEDPFLQQQCYYNGHYRKPY